MGEEYGNIPFTLYDGEFSNSLMQAMYEKYTDAKFVASLFPSSRMLSIRSNKPDVHCCEIAKSYAYEGRGGGHAGAAGCTLSVDDTIAILKDVFKAIDERNNNG